MLVSIELLPYLTLRAFGLLVMLDTKGWLVVLENYFIGIPKAE
jgi:hypothetical protein